MISAQELMRKQKELGVPLPTLEKDYVLGLLLACFYRHPVLKDAWVFKGWNVPQKGIFRGLSF